MRDFATFLLGFLLSYHGNHVFINKFNRTLTPPLQDQPATGIEGAECVLPIVAIQTQISLENHILGVVNK